MGVIKTPITTVAELLERMHIKWQSRKTLTELSISPHEARGGATLEEHYDDGKGHSGALSVDYTIVTWPTFLEAGAASFIEGKPMMGYVSQTRFRLSALGEAEWERIEQERIAKKKAGAESQPQE